jgi:hypothetical protein
MKTFNIANMVGGWFVGNFEPTAFKTTNCEVCFKQHHKGEFWTPHIHKVATEVNYMIKGKMVIQGQTFVTGDVFVLEPGDVSDPIFLEDCELIVVKVPAVPGDKYDV